MTLKDKMLFLCTVSAFQLLTIWNFCLLTFCKTISIPDWLSIIYFSLGIPFGGNFLVAGTLMLPMAILCDKHRTAAITIFLVPALISLMKTIPGFNPEYDFFNLAIDYLIAFIPISVMFYIPYSIRKLKSR